MVASMTPCSTALLAEKKYATDLALIASRFSQVLLQESFTSKWWLSFKVETVKVFTLVLFLFRNGATKFNLNVQFFVNFSGNSGILQKTFFRSRSIQGKGHAATYHFHLTPQKPYLIAYKSAFRFVDFKDGFWKTGVVWLKRCLKIQDARVQKQYHVNYQ